MESNNPKSIIIEFNGLPGSGKTTVANILKKKLKENYGVEVKNHYERKPWHRNVYSILFYPRYYKLLISISNYSKSFFKKKPFGRRLKIANFVREYRNFFSDNKGSVLLIDQGIIQAVISLAHQDNLPSSDSLGDVICKTGITVLPVVIVNCNLAPEISAERVKKRPSNGCRVEKMDEPELLDSLKTQYDNLEYIRSLLYVFSPRMIVEIDTALSPEENANKIMDLIHKSLLN